MKTFYYAFHSKCRRTLLFQASDFVIILLKCCRSQIICEKSVYKTQTPAPICLDPISSDAPTFKITTYNHIYIWWMFHIYLNNSKTLFIRIFGEKSTGRSRRVILAPVFYHRWSTGMWRVIQSHLQVYGGTRRHESQYIQKHPHSLIQFIPVLLCACYSSL